MMRPKLATINLTTQGEVINPSDNVTLIVGPNNVGKSAIIAGISAEISKHPSHSPQVVTPPVASVEVTMPPLDQYLALVGQRATLYPAGNHPNLGTLHGPTFVFPNGGNIQEAAIQGLAQRKDWFGELASHLHLVMGPEGRGGVLGSSGLPDLMSDQGRSPMQMLWADRDLEKLISGYMERAFGRPLLVNRHAGANTHLHIGKLDIPEPQIGTKSPYLEAAMKLPLLATQGSGMQAFMGTVLTLATGNHDIILLDEPETFLHPPQARLLGEVVAEMSRAGGPQVIAATHSDDFVQGVVSASKGTAEVTIVRITRPSDAENRAAQVEPSAIKSLYTDPLLRHSKIIDGIFYKGVVLCEAESDCTYYAAALSEVEDLDKRGASDLLFTQCGGKDRLPRAYKALHAAAVPTAVIADVDLLADKTKFKELFEALGGAFATIEASYNVLASSVKSNAIEPERKQVREEFDKILKQSNEKHFSRKHLDELNALIRAESGWKQVKRKGQGAIDSGDPTASFTSILAACSQLGLFVLSIGELERFHPEVSGNKQEWLRKVLEQEIYKSSKEAQTLLREVLTFVGQHQ
jgi:hypothetical protein